MGLRTSCHFVQVRDLLSATDQDVHERRWREMFPDGINGKYHDVCANDPGSRTFACLFVPRTAKLVRIGHGFGAHLFTKFTRPAQVLQAHAARTHDQATRQRLLRKAEDLFRRRKRAVKKLHKTASTFLRKSFDAIVQPILRTGPMSRKAGGKRKLGGRATGSMLALRHAEFNELLERLCSGPMSTCTLFAGASEWGTSKTCGCCGAWRANLGADKTYHCATCGAALDRDGDAARCIFLRWLLADLTDAERDLVRHFG